MTQSQSFHPRWTWPRMADKEIHLRHPLQRIIPGAPVWVGLEILEVLEDRIRKMEIEQSICSCSPEEPILLCTSDLLEHLLHSERRRWLSLSLSLSHDPCRKFQTWSGYPTSRYIPPFPIGIAKWKNPALNTGPVSDLMTVPLGQSSQHLHLNKKHQDSTLCNPRFCHWKIQVGILLKLSWGCSLMAVRLSRFLLVAFSYFFLAAARGFHEPGCRPSDCSMTFLNCFQRGKLKHWWVLKLGYLRNMWKHAMSLTQTVN